MSAQLTEPLPFTASSDIRSIHRTLHLLYHHNKNQHRCTKWWKWLNMLRRWTLNLACEIEKIEKFEDVLGADGSDEHPFAPVWKIMRYLHDELIPRCYRAFSTVVADVQFCSLGIALLATLAEVFNVVQINKGELSNIASELGDEKGPETIPRSASNVTVDEDFGEVIRRSEVDSHVRTTVDTVVSTDGEAVTKKKRKSCFDKSMKRKVDYDTSMTASLGEADSSKEKKKKKKRKVNVIDDIFAGL
ncbi:hypothetical protein H112_02686 [Trichophyton rubrum D6]|uniref:RNase MRP protein 1 RNA binding domain-containing protein n=4 Tax=Trichophyton TaxID=5550 RepID=F2STX5_TRIRC|nr:uncharacterized protein TERG_06444 [Trichophyton rubrum CBS 118892]EZF24852.1 hypothetical protein H100_02692 [Trichophyton rubrum MR850]EZF43907.1 hypothetical protein H102_02684 [Trichophyton rubrum CBS 100081]EZF54568.1 hypothetical protein H103_02696 [Trichophyton rubrum CBS 288.86]EZF65311.1 hypothetical protein H104_02675 [Trichophyton rubrum CBS 289.86]EZF75734.1 hypothetical protein H105_02701 [Trichophyton soudanense CBS 452.61]EZF86462.1 hypothetical protein H110_02693 [Trichophy